MNAIATLRTARRAAHVAGLAAAAIPHAAAATATATFQVTANAQTQCNVSAVDLAFGTVDPLGGNADQSTTVTVHRTKNTPYTVGLNAGTTTGATLAQRLMANGTDTMNYNPYTDAARTTVWGNSAAAPTGVSGTGAGLGTAQVLTVYGRAFLPRAQPRKMSPEDCISRCPVTTRWPWSE